MAESVPDALTAALVGCLRTGGEDAPPLEIGGFRLADAPAFGGEVADAFALAHGGLPRREEFRRLWTARDTPKPARPSPELIEAEAQSLTGDPAKLPYAKALVAELMGKDYNAKLSDYEAKRRQRDHIEQGFENSDLGYLRYLCAACPEARGFFFENWWTLPISEESRKRHTYVTGGSGSGKSEALKAILLHYLTTSTATAVVVIDPTGKLSGEVSRWPELADGKRLAYIDPAGIDGRLPVFNPLDIPEAERNPDDIAIVVKQFLEVFPELFEGMEFTFSMVTLLSACLTVMLYTPGSSLLDLMDFLDDDKNAQWLERAERVLPSGSMYRDFLRREFRDKTMDITKRGVRLRFTNALESNPAFARMIIGQSTFSLEHLLDHRAVVVFRLTKGEIGEAASRLIGKFVVARLKAYGFRQGRMASKDRVPVHIFIDECHNFLSESVEVILKEARQYGLHLTLAQQILGADMSPALLNCILGNTDVKITGKNALHTLKRMADETGADLAELQNLSTGQFHIKSGTRPSVMVTIPGRRIDDKGAVPPEVWERVKADQAARFYRTPDQPRAAKAKAGLPQLPID